MIRRQRDVICDVITAFRNRSGIDDILHLAQYGV